MVPRISCKQRGGKSPLHRAVLFAAGLAFAANSASAQPTDDPVALFQTGLAEMQAGRYESGCPKLAASHELEPLPGVLFTLAECEAAWGKTATAIDRYQTFVGLLTTLPADRRPAYEERHRIALDKIAALSASAPELVIDLAPSTPRDVVVKRNGVVFPPEGFGVSKRVDPGEYVISAERDGEVVWERRYALHEQDRAHVRIALGVQPPSSAPPSVANKTEGASHDASTRAIEARSGPPTAAVVIGVIGAVGIGGGLAAGSVAWSKKSTIEEKCPNRQCDDEGRAAVDSARSAATISTVSVGLGAVGVAVAGIWWMLSESPEKQAAFSHVPMTLRPQIVLDTRTVGFGLTGEL